MQPSTWNETNQHWISQFLLKGFGIRGKASTVYELDKRTKAVTVRNVREAASKMHLLTDRDDEMMRDIERRATETVEAIRKGHLNRVGEDGRKAVDKLVCAMMLNDPYGGADAEATREEVIHEGVSDLSEGVQRLGQTPDETHFQSSLDEMLGHNWLSGFMGSASNWIVIALGLMGLRAYKATDGEFFIIGDSPVLVVPNATNGNADLLNPSAQVILPIRSDYILVYAWTTDKNVIDNGGTLDKAQVRSLNSDYYHWTKSRCIYGRNEETVRRSGMLTLAGRPLERSNHVSNGWFMMQEIQRLMQRRRKARNAVRARAREYAAREFVDAAIAKSGPAQVCHFSRPGPELNPAASTAFGRIDGRMAELLMNSAIPSE